MIINRAYRYEAVLTANLEKKFVNHAGCARFAYNWGLDRRIEMYKESNKSTNAMEQHRELNKLKKTDFPWMYDVSKCAMQEALINLDRSFKNFFRGIKKNQNIGYPNFKQKGFKDSFRLTGTIKVKDNTIQLPVIGIVNLKEVTDVKGRILSVTVSREADRWFVSISVEEEIADPDPVQGEAVGIDLGLTFFATISNGEKISGPKPLNRKLKLLKRRSKQHSKKQPGSNNKKKSRIRLSRTHRDVRNVRVDFLHKVTTKLAKTKSVIVIEDLNVRGMVRCKNLSRHISDAGWGEFRRMLEYKTKWYGSKLIIAPRFYASSKTCSECEKCAKELPLKIRDWECENCHSVHDRDVNAAKNLLKFCTGSSPGIHACGDTSNGASIKNTCSYVSLKQEVVME